MSGRKVFKLIISDVIALLFIWSIALAATFTTNVGNYKNGDYRATQKVASSNDYLYVEKSAKWNNDAKTEAIVKIEVQSKQKKSLGKLQKADILIIADKSKSAYGYYSAYTNVKDFEKDVIGYAATKFVTGEYAGAGNRVAFMDFAEAAWLYNKSGVINASGYSYGDYSKASDKKDYSPLWRGGLESSDSLKNMKAREDNLKSRYTSLKNTLGDQLMSKTDSLFFSAESDIKTVINKAANFTPSSKNTYTNIDVPLTMANLILERRSDKSRTAFVIFFTDGTPDPIYAVQQSKGMYAMDSTSWQYQDGMMSKTEGYNGTMATARQWRVKNYYPMNFFYKRAGQDLRNDAEEIFFLRTGSDSNVNGDPYVIWNNITRGIGTHGTGDSLWPQVPLLPVNYYSRDGGDLSGATSSSNNNIHVIGSSSSQAQAISKTDEVLSLIEAYLKPSSSTQKVPLNCTVTDVINYDLFNIVDKSWTSNNNQNKITYNSSSKTITWPISGINYGDKISNKWPYIEFKITLKSNSTGGKINTNYITNVNKSNDVDKSCQARTGITAEAIDVPSPWLEREADVGNIYANWLLKSGSSYSAISGITRYSDVNKPYNTYTVANNVGGRDLSDYIYLGYCVENGNVAANKATVGSLTSNATASVTLNKDNKNKTIHFILEEKPAKGSIYANWLLRDGTTYSAFSGISRYSSTELDFGSYDVSNTEGKRSVDSSKYKYIGYAIQNGNITADKVSIKETNIKSGAKASVAVSDTARVKTVHFIYEEVKGTVKVRHVLIASTNVASLIEPSNKKYNYTSKDVTLGSYSATKAYSNSNYKYVGYKIDEGLISTTNYNLESAFKAGEKASVTLTATKNEYTITFAYIDNSLTKLGVGLEVKHYDTINGQEIPAPDKVTRKWEDLSDLIVSLYSKESNKDDVIKSINIIASNKNLSENERVAKIYEDYIKPKWNSCAGVKSFNTTKTQDNKMSVYEVINEMGIKSKKSSSETKITSVDVGKTQRVPNVDEVISNIRGKSVLPSGTKNDTMITINIYYLRDCRVTFEHYDKETNKKITTIGDKYVNAKINTDANYNPTADDGLKTYTFIPEDTRIVLPTNASQSLIKESTETNVKIGPLTTDYTVRLFYVKNRTIKFVHYDWETKEKISTSIKADKTIPSVKYNTNIKYTDYEIPGYTYLPEQTKQGKNGTPVVDPNIIEVGPVLKNDEFIVYYVKDRVVKVIHEDIYDGTKLEEETFYLKYQESCTVDALTDDELVKYGSENEYKYVYEKGKEVSGKRNYQITPPNNMESIDSNTEAEMVVLPKSREDTTVVFRYVKYWKVEVYYKDFETGEEIHEPDYDWVETTKEGQKTQIPIDYYKYRSNEVNNDLNDEFAPTVVYVGDGKVIITFFYLRKPTIESEIHPGDDIPLPSDPSDPSSPSHTGGPFANKKLIVLDDIFGVKYTIKNGDRLEYDAEVRFKFPFDVYYGDKFIKAGTSILIKDIPVGTITTRDYSDEVFFRLPSWIIEKDYKMDEISGLDQLTYVTLRYKEPQPDEEDPLSQEEHEITVIGRLYDFTVTAIEENVSLNQARWTMSLFKSTNSVLDVEYKADTLPIGQNKVSSNVSTYPKNPPSKNWETQDHLWRHGLAIGTPFLFSINTKGLLSNKISIEPKLEYYDINGNKVNGVKFKYRTYQGEIDFTNAQGVVTGNESEFSTTLTKSTRYTVQVQKEINKANLLQKGGVQYLLGEAKKDYTNEQNAYLKFTQMSSVKFGSYNRLLIPNTLRLPFVDYYPEPASLDNLRYNEVHRIGNKYTNDVYYNIANRVSDKLNYINSNEIGKYKTDASAVGMNQDAIVNSLGHWYAEYSLPSSLTVKDASGKELKNGYVVVKFKIRSMREALLGETAGDKSYLTYWIGEDYGSVLPLVRSNRYLSSQWTKENYNLHDSSNEKLSKTSFNVNFPIIGNQNSVVTKPIDMADGYYPVAIFEAGFSIDDFQKIAGTH